MYVHEWWWWLCISQPSNQWEKPLSPGPCLCYHQSYLYRNTRVQTRKNHSIWLCDSHTLSHRDTGSWLMPFNSYWTSASTWQNFFPLSQPPSAPLPHSYLSFLVGVRQINVNAGFTYHTVASTTLQATEWEQTAIQSTPGASKVVLQLHNTCTHCTATYWLAPFTNVWHGYGGWFYW